MDRMELHDYTIETLARRMGVSPDTIRREIRRGELAAYKVGRLVRITNQSAERYIERRTRRYRRLLEERDAPRAGDDA